MNREQLSLYFICGTADCTQKDILEVVREALRAGVTMFQFREKGKAALKGQGKRTLAKQLQALCREYGVPFIIDDDIQLVLELDADGLHIGQKDLPVQEARKLLPDKIIGLSVGTVEEYHHSAIDKADYIGVGPVFPTISKDDAKKAIGTKGIEAIRQINSELPIVAIGGITARDVREIKAAGADGVAVISAISRSENVSAATEAFKKELT